MSSDVCHLDLLSILPQPAGASRPLWSTCYILSDNGKMDLWLDGYVIKITLYTIFYVPMVCQYTKEQYFQTVFICRCGHTTITVLWVHHLTKPWRCGAPMLMIVGSNSAVWKVGFNRGLREGKLGIAITSTLKNRFLIIPEKWLILILGLKKMIKIILKFGLR